MNFNEYIGKGMTENERIKINDKLDSIFKGAEIRRYISSRHPELFPRYVSVEFSSDNMPHWISMEHQTIYWGEYSPGWYSYGLRKDCTIIPEVLEFYKERDPEFHTFLTKVI
ncbi:MAG: hypothetical protein K2N09_01125 [Muribaculaceae bacterium]|nr:hypothetical protein [Muribaculaceae bacterium]